MGVVASCFYRKVCNAFLEHLIRRVWESKKLMDDWNAEASDGRLRRRKKHIYGETLSRAL
jgi:hypothetical protein